jgi:LysM repeat protein
MGTPKGNSRIKDEKIMKNYAIQMAESIEQYYEELSKYKKHKVQSGDVLGKIAEKYGVSLESLKKHNGLTSNNIRVGQVLEIPPKP